MTTPLLAVQESRIRACVESKFGDALDNYENVVVQTGKVIMVWIDESSGYSGYGSSVPPSVFRGRWNEDMRNYQEAINTVLADFPDFNMTKGMVVHVAHDPAFSDGRITPPGVPFPDAFRRRQTPRPPTFEDNRGAFLDALSTSIRGDDAGNLLTRVTSIEVSTDASGSIAFGDLRPGIVEFQEWLRSINGTTIQNRIGGDVEIARAAFYGDTQFGDERWVRELTP